MTIFSYNIVDNTLTLNTPEILLVKEFGDLLGSERNKCTQDKKGTSGLRAFREFKYIYLMIDWQSPYSQYSEHERDEAARSDSDITEEEFNDPVFRAACRKYRDLQDSARDIKLIKAAQHKVDELIDYFNNDSDPTERDTQTGKPIFQAKNIIAEVSSIDKVLDELEELENRTKKKYKAATGLRAGAEEGYIPN